MSQNQSVNVLFRILSEVFDVYPTTEFVNKYITNGKNVNIDMIMGDQFLRLSVIYSKLWNFVYGTYATKKDFVAFCKQYGHHYDNPVGQFDKQLLEQIVNSFIHLKIGLLGQVRIEDIQREYLNIVQNTKDKQYIVDSIANKIAYRFGITDELVTSNVIVMVLNAIKNCKHTYVNDNEPNVNPLTQSVNEFVSFTVEDSQYMSVCERTQYIIYQDFHFMMQLIDNIIIDVNDTNTPLSTLNMLIDTGVSTSDRPVVLFNSSLETADPLYSFKIHSDILTLLPRVAKSYIKMSHEKYPCQIALTRNDTNAIYFLRYPFFNNAMNIKACKSYDRYIVNTCNATDLESLKDISLHKYVILDPTPSKTKEQRSADKYVVLDTNKTLLSYGFYPTYNIDVHSERKEGQIYDIIVDTTDQCDALLYLREGAIPVTSKQYSCIKHLVNGIVVPDITGIGSLMSMLSNNPSMIKTLQRGGDVIRYIMNHEFVSLQWKMHLQHGCPRKSQNHRNNILLFYEFLVHYLLGKVEEIMTIAKYPDAPNCALLIDNRPNILSIFSVLITMCNLNESWTCVVYTSEKGYQYYKDHLGDIADVFVHKMLHTKKFHIDTYNMFLTSEELWDSLEKYDKCLTIQDDGIIVRKGIEAFLPFDYVGAPWLDGPGNEYLKQHVNSDLVGNGGLSLRTISLMKRISKEFQKEKKTLFFNNLNNVPEDVYFCRYAKKLNANMPTSAQAAAFSSEEIINTSSLGMHKVWAYHSPEVVANFFKQMLVSVQAKR
jgi:hypothetical protein